MKIFKKYKSNQKISLHLTNMIKCKNYKIKIVNKIKIFNYFKMTFNPNNKRYYSYNNLLKISNKTKIKTPVKKKKKTKKN